MQLSAVKQNKPSILTSLSDPWQGGLLLVSLILAIPVLVVFSSIFFPQWDLWQHLIDTVLADYVSNSLILAFFVGLGSLVIGSLLAWALVRYEFPGRSVLQWMVLLPLAMPAYIIAYSYTGMLDFSGPVQSFIRETFELRYGQYWFPEIRSLPGAICMMVLVLYPYVYMLARTAFSEQSASLFEASRSMGYGQSKHFFKVALPLARPAILTGTALAMMEAFADYGTVQYFGVNTFTTGIFRTWFGLGNGIGAAQLSALLCTFVLILLVYEKWSRRHIQYYHQGQKHRSQPRQQLSHGKGIGLAILCFLAPLLGFILPSLQLIDWAIQTAEQQFNAEFLTLWANSFMLAAIAAVVVVAIALLLAYGKRLRPGKLISAQVQVASLGYAIPGTVIAIGVLLPLTWADKSLNALTISMFDWRPGLILSGTIFALILAYSVRFLSVALHNVEAGLGRITPHMDEAARSLGRGPAGVLREVHVPLLRASVLSATLLVFVDVLKELPATLVLRPFNFNTLAVRSFEMASDERLADAALPALSIVIVGIIPVMLLTRSLEKERFSK